MNDKTELQKLAIKNVKNNISEEELQLRENFPKGSTKDGVYSIAEYLVEKYHIKTIPDGNRNFFYLYNDGFYTVVDEGSLKNKAEIILDRLLSNHLTNEIIGKIKRLTFCERKEIEKNDLNLICVNNGILNIETLELKPHTPDIFFFRKIPVKYDPDAKCPEVMKFLEGIADEEDMPLIQEWFGFPLYRKYFLKKALIIYGEPDTGKTTLVNLLINFIGDDNVSGLALQELGIAEKFRQIQLYEKFLNVKDDLDAYDVKRTGALKTVTGLSRITAQRKFGDEFEFTNFAKMIFVGNTIPSTKDLDDDAYYGRWIIIEFDKIFGGGEKDIDLANKISTPEELSGVLNWALVGLKRLRENKKFSFELSIDDVKQTMMQSASIVAEFVAMELEESTGDYVTKEDMYIAFQRFSRQKRVPVMTKSKLGRGIVKYSNYIIDGRKSIKGVRPTAWLNVKLQNQDNTLVM